MTTEKEWWDSSYAEDIHKHLKFKERKRYLYRGCSPQLYMRRSIIGFLDALCDKMDFCTTVKHLAVYLLDIFMDNHSINTKHMEMVTVGCLIVAVKLEEQDNLVPKHSDFNKFLVPNYKLSEFVQMEVSILTFFNWDILFPTAAHFTEYYFLYCVQPTDLLNGQPITAYEDVDIFLKKYVEYFLDVSIRDKEYLMYKPSVVAASCIAATRHCILLKPPWPDILVNITNYKLFQLEECIELFLKALDEDMLKEVNKTVRKAKSSCDDAAAAKESKQLKTTAVVGSTFN